MTIANLVEALKLGEQGGFCVAGLVVLGWEDARAFVEAAEETGLPIILQAGPGCRAQIPIPVLGSMFRHLAERAKVPVACHIDHAYTRAECVEGIDCGFTSVMIDGSKHALPENIALTASVVEAAHRARVSVEGEIGVVGYADGRPSTTTTPEEARTFEIESGIDALAVSVGNVHLNPTRDAVIDFAALREIEAATTVPLVIHGGSGVPLATRKRLARETRVRKLNIGTELRMAFDRALRGAVANRPGIFDRLELLDATLPAMRSEAAAAILSLRR